MKEVKKRIVTGGIDYYDEIKILKKGKETNCKCTEIVSPPKKKHKITGNPET